MLTQVSMIKNHLVSTVNVDKVAHVGYCDCCICYQPLYARPESAPMAEEQKEVGIFTRGAREMWRSAGDKCEKMRWERNEDNSYL